MQNTKICTKCKTQKSLDNFPKRTSAGKEYFHSFCSICKNLDSKRYRSARPTGFYNGDYEKYERKYRLDPSKRGKYILIDCQKSDRKKGLECDLDRIFVDECIKIPCAYCGDNDCKKTLDRIDNTLGHLKYNVVTCCIRCNLTRGDMPYDAWLCLIDGMKKARTLGFFGDWEGKFKRNKKRACGETHNSEYPAS